ncbi:MAG: DUF1552 domain-containing protein, partial [Bradymonadaceae bacterium]
MSQIDRRTFLRGAAGSALALPALEAAPSLLGGEADDEAQAAESSGSGPDDPRYYIVCFAGTATGASGKYDNTEDHVDCVPDGPNATGTDYPLSDPALRPLDRELDVHGRDGTVRTQEYVSMISGLSMPEATEPNNKPPGSRVGYDSNREFHKYQVAPMLTGVSSEQAGSTQEAARGGTSSDQVVADHWNQKGQTFAGRVQFDNYGKYPGTNPLGTPLSQIDRGDGTEVVTPHIKLRDAFEAWIGSNDQSGPSRRELLMGSSDQSVLDGVLREFNRLKKETNLPRADKKRL